MAARLTEIHCPSALLADRWATDVLFEIDAHGAISAIATEVDAQLHPRAHRLRGPVVPGMSNLHSHAFQRAIAGCTQVKGPGRDSFWTWRRAMYASLDRLGPDTLQAVAAGLYMELLEAGFTSIGEFHYVHHPGAGERYSRPAELSHRIVQAARDTGIGLTHLPVLYMTAGFDEGPLGLAQGRFGWDPQGVLSVVEAVHQDIRHDADHAVGLAPHSLRAVPPAPLSEAVAGLHAQWPDAPVHIHIAEQTAEVEGCLEVRGARPVQWLLDHLPVDDRWCLVHATHVDSAEVAGIVKAEAVAGLCPTTEADLGDGLFPAGEFLASGGRVGVGTDSHVGRAAAGELRLLEYGQRLQHRARNLVLPPGEVHNGAGLWRAAVRGGAQALGRASASLSVGQRADLVSFDALAPGLVALDGDHLLDAVIFGGTTSAVDTVIVGGRLCVKHGRHVDRDRLVPAFRTALRSLRS